MLTSLKDKLINASKIGLLSPSAEEKSVNLSIDLNAGAAILNNFQEEWVELHRINEENAENAAKLAETIGGIYTKINKDYNNIMEIIHLLNTTPVLNKSMETCLNQVHNMYKSFESTEKKLLDLEDVIERVELEKRKMEHTYQFNLYKEKKVANLEKFRVELAIKHTEHVKQHEMKEKQILKERQQVFQDAFNSDLELYKSLGSIPKIETNVQPSALLEEIQLDLDQNDLETFLNTN